jgi:hypothetical protein
MYPRTHLLGLPRELRLAIYENYVAVDKGLFYKPEYGKLGRLVTADNQPVDMALMLTCSLIAVEMKGM